MGARVRRASRFRTTVPCRQALVRSIKMEPTVLAWADGAMFKVDGRLSLRLFHIPLSLPPLF
jgi:hypothetical protein